MERLREFNYSHGNKAFLQALLARGTMTFEDSRPVIAAIQKAERRNADDDCSPDQVTEELFLDYIEAASVAASLFDYEIRSGVHQITKQRIYALVNTTSDPQTQLATTYSPEEISFIKRLLDALFDGFNRPRMELMCIMSTQAMKLARPPKRRESNYTFGNGNGNGNPPASPSTAAAQDKGLKHSEVESVLSSLLAGGWFEKSREGFYSLTPRALLELRPWLVESYNDPDAGPDDWQRIKFCEACKDIVTHGMRCIEPDCLFRLHDICEDAYWRTRKEKKCPKCARDWVEKLYVGERSMTSTEAYRKSHKRSGAQRSTLADEIFRAANGGINGQGADGESE